MTQKTQQTKGRELTPDELGLELLKDEVFRESCRSFARNLIRMSKKEYPLMEATNEYQEKVNHWDEDCRCEECRDEAFQDYIDAIDARIKDGEI